MTARNKVVVKTLVHKRLINEYSQKSLFFPSLRSGFPVLPLDTKINQIDICAKDWGSGEQLTFNIDRCTLEIILLGAGMKPKQFLSFPLADQLWRRRMRRTLSAFKGTSSTLEFILKLKVDTSELCRPAEICTRILVGVEQESKLRILSPDITPIESKLAAARRLKYLSEKIQYNLGKAQSIEFVERGYNPAAFVDKLESRPSGEDESFKQGWQAVAYSWSKGSRLESSVIALKRVEKYQQQLLEQEALLMSY